MLTFTPITLEHHALLRKYYAGCDYHLCEYSAGTKLMWSLYLRPSFCRGGGLPDRPQPHRRRVGL